MRITRLRQAYQQVTCLHAVVQASDSGIVPVTRVVCQDGQGVVGVKLKCEDGVIKRHRAAVRVHADTGQGLFGVVRGHVCGGHSHTTDVYGVDCHVRRGSGAAAQNKRLGRVRVSASRGVLSNECPVKVKLQRVGDTCVAIDVRNQVVPIRLHGGAAVNCAGRHVSGPQLIGAVSCVSAGGQAKAVPIKYVVVGGQLSVLPVEAQPHANGDAIALGVLQGNGRSSAGPRTDAPHATGLKA